MIDKGASLALVCTAIILAGCAGNDNKTSTDSSAGAMSTTSSTSSASTTTARTDSANASVDPSQYTDANILAKESAGDSGEVAIATMAKTKASSAAVKSYAQRLITDHSKGQKEVAALAKKLSITPQVAAGDTTTQAISHAMTRLQGIADGAAFDTAFVNHEVEDHQQDIKDAEAMSGAARNSEVKSLVQKSLPELRSHLDAAQKLTKAKS